ncbi:MAG: hypothetical protein OEZ22_00105 [Spirochaetia bacterium]|nr:hypothetical protein [Spirochaetia bacterium]
MFFNNQKRIINSENFLLLIGFLLLFFTNLRWNISYLAYFVLIPYIRYLRLGFSKKKLFWILLFSFIFSISKIASDFKYFYIALTLGLHLSIAYFLIFVISNYIKNKLNESSGIIIIPALLVSAEFILAKVTTLGIWGMLSNTQLENLTLLQISSITGAFGISFMIGWVNAAVESIIYYYADTKNSNHHKTIKIHTAFILITFFMIFVFGTIRLNINNNEKTIKSSVIVNKYNTFDFFINENNTAQNTNDLLEKTSKAADMGAKIAVWPEGAAIINLKKENEFIETLCNLAREKNIHIVAAYILLYPDKTIKYNNKLQWITAEGKSHWVYHKQYLHLEEPVLFEKTDFKTHTFDFGMASAAISYDFDNIDISHFFGKTNSAIIASPSSDWAGIDPFHTKLARLRSIENGYSTLRAARGSMSAIFDQYGRIKNFINYYDDEIGIAVAEVSVNNINTIYSQIGNFFAILCIVISSAYFINAYRNKE